MTEHKAGAVRKWGPLVGLGMAATIAIGSLMQGPPVPDLPQGDKLMHLGGYAVLATWWMLALPRHRGKLLIAIVLYGVLLEGLQGLTDYRSCDPLDMCANACGALIGLGLSVLIQRLLGGSGRAAAN